MYIEDRVITLNLWDTAGQEKFKSLIPSYIKDSQAIVVVYDITSRESFESVEKWMTDARELRDVDQALIVLVGNKSDLVGPDLVDQETAGLGRRVSYEEAAAFANQKEIMFFEISALNGQNVQILFNEVAKKLTGIETDLVKQSGITVGQGYGVAPGSSTGTDSN